MTAPAVRVVCVTRSSGAGGRCAVWYRWTVEVDGSPLLCKRGRVRSWGTPERAARVASKAGCGK